MTKAVICEVKVAAASKTGWRKEQPKTPKQVKQKSIGQRKFAEDEKYAGG
ncbi:hypothetical protein [Microcoleus sp. herbarium14]